MLSLMALIVLLSANAAFGWTFDVTNLTETARSTGATYAGSAWAFGKCFSCCDDNVTIAPGGTVNFDAKGCLLTSISTPGGTPYTSSGQMVYKQFYIIGPIDGSYKVGRIEEL